MNMGAKIKHVRGMRNITQEELAKQAEVSADTIGRLEAETSKARPSTLYKIAQALAVPFAWFTDPRQGMEALGEIPDGPAQQREHAPIRGTGAPTGAVYPIGSAWNKAWLEGARPKAKGSFPFPPGLSDKDAFWCQMSGNSMEPDFLEGDLLLILPNERSWAEGSACFVQMRDEAAIVRVYATGPETLRLVPSNRAHQEWHISHSAVVSIWPVAAMCRMSGGTFRLGEINTDAA